MDVWLERLRREIEEIAEGIAEADWRRAPEGQWCGAEILEHMGRSYGGTAKMVEANLVPGAVQPRGPTLSERLRQFYVVSMGFFPSGRKAPEFVRPRGISGPVALERALQGLARMQNALAACEQRWGKSAPVGAHFLLGPMSAEQWRKFHYLHGHQHLLQMRARIQS